VSGSSDPDTQEPPVFGTATFVRRPDGYEDRADVGVYRLSPAYHGRRYVVVSTAPSAYNGHMLTSVVGSDNGWNATWKQPEHPSADADEDGRPELDRGSWGDEIIRGPWTRAEALTKLGYQVEINVDAAAAAY
jgi:hypothetical protein